MAFVNARCEFTCRKATLLRPHVPIARGDAAGGRAFVGVELGPDGEVVGDLQGLVDASGGIAAAKLKTPQRPVNSVVDGGGR